MTPLTGVSPFHALPDDTPPGRCRCDAFPVEHDAGIDPGGECVCEKAITGPLISPHLFPRSAWDQPGVTSPSM